MSTTSVDARDAAQVSGESTVVAIRRWTSRNAIVVLTVAMFMLLTATTSRFATSQNLVNVLEQNSPLLIVAMGTTFVIISGAFDLSTGQAVSLCGVIGAKIALSSGNPLLGVVCGILVGIPLGYLNGFCVGRLRLNSFLATLATGLVFSGVALFVTAGYSFDLSASNNFRYFGAARWAGIPLPVITSLIVAVVLSVLLSRTVIGRNIYCVGSNQEAARLSGLSDTRVKLVAYAIGGLCAAIAGLILTTRTGVGNVYADANSMTLNAIAAVVIGGTSITGGRGAVWRTVFGVLLLAMMNNALNLLNAQPYWQQIVSGAIILVAVLANSVSARSAYR